VACLTVKATPPEASFRKNQIVICGLFSALYVFTYYYYFLQLGNLFTILHTKTILVIKRRCWNKKTKQIFEEECKTNKKPIVLPRFSINQEMKENRKKKLSILPTYFLVVKSDLKNPSNCRRRRLRKSQNICEYKLAKQRKKKISANFPRKKKINNVFAHCPTKHTNKFFPFFLLYLERVFPTEREPKSTKIIETHKKIQITTTKKKKQLKKSICVWTPGDEKH